MDMVLYLQKQTDYLYKKEQNRKGIAICLKSDKESIFSEQEKEAINEIAKKLGEKLIFTDTVTGYSIDKWQRFQELNRKLNEFAGYQLIITDRLHGLLFSILTQTPCILLNGVSHKNRGIYKKLSKYIEIFYAENIDDLGKILNNRKNEIPVWKIIDKQGFQNYITQELDKLNKIFQID